MNLDMPFVLILDRAHGAAFARKVPPMLPLHSLVADWIRTDAPLFVYCQGPTYATGRGITDAELPLIIRAAVKGSSGAACRWSLAVNDIDEIEAIIKDETLRAAAVAGHG
jgi:hypothetical protein